ncbi:hypothetical protein GCM10010399_53860 [Dactylosporangium fulvum]|uniref:DUF2345 domain-containing protein n=1 Tax=Dactylosporangium fulvum TaxID=53359 RepID=A0ABY5WAZ0_9ACTN|nr:DUF2345 domain-containing protein [Dactylosporangium fulvum]UWP87248.1 DUF2345 domain-containing protein [Dactylosporangium fulvum]
MNVPPYLGLLAVDAEQFSKNSDVRLPEFGVELESLLGQAMHKSGLAHVWEQRMFPDPAGDGYVFGYPPEFTPRIVEGLLPNLQIALADRNTQTDRYSPLMRVRVAVHVGPVYSSGDPKRDGSGTSRVLVHRLLDSDQLKQVLRRSDSRVTCVAAMLSARAMNDAVEAERCTVQPSELVEVQATVSGKEFGTAGYVYVPRPSGLLLTHGIHPLVDQMSPAPVSPTGQAPSTPASAATASSRHIDTNYGQAIDHVAGNAVFHAGSALPDHRRGGNGRQ